jgi:hypothetical protein
MDRLSGKDLPFCRHVGMSACRQWIAAEGLQAKLFASKKAACFDTFFILLSYPLQKSGIRGDKSWHVVCLSEFASECGHVPPKH